MTPIGHVGISLPVAYGLRLSLPVTFLCALLPDLLDKFLWALGIGSGYYIGHTLLFVLLLAAGLSLHKRAYGLSALLGGVSHLLLDPTQKVPWFYPFIQYDFNDHKFNPSDFFPRLFEAFRENFTVPKVSQELISVALSVVAVYVISRLYLWLKRKRAQKTKK